MKSNELFAEFLGTFILLVAVVGSGIMGETLAGGNVAIALLANSIATGAALYVLIHVLGPISGAHFNPAVSLYFKLEGSLSLQKMLSYWCFQILGGILGVLFTHIMFNLDIFQTSSTVRNGLPLAVSEVFATFGLLLTIVGFVKYAPQMVPAGVALYITGAYWFTPSTSFANPAVAIARTLTDTFSGIAPESLVVFVVAQLLGVFVAFRSWEWLTQGRTNIHKKLDEVPELQVQSPQ